MKKNFWSVLLIISVLATSGCVTGRRSIDLVVPEGQQAVPMTKGTVAIVSVIDRRAFEAKPASPATPSIDGDSNKASRELLNTMIGRQRNSYGKAMGDIEIASGQTVETKMRALLEEGFRRRGYTVADSPSADHKANVSIQKFWAWFSPGFWAVSFDSELRCEIALANQDKTHTLIVAGFGKNTGQVASDENWQLAYARGFEDFLKNFDVALTNAGL